MAQLTKEALQGKTPLVCGMADDSAAAGLKTPEGGLVTGLSKRTSIRNLLSYALMLRPEAGHVALLHAPNDPRQQEVQALTGAWEGNFKATAASPEQMLEQARALLPDSDLLLLTEDFTDEQAIKELSALAEQAGKLICGADKAQVAAGLPAACVIEARDAGITCGYLSARVLGGTDAASIPWQSPQAVVILYNQESLETFGITPPYAAIPWMGE